VGRRATIILTAALSFASVACGGGNVEVTRLFSPADAAKAQDGKLVPTAIVRGGVRIDVPEDARVEATRIVLPSSSRAYVHKLRPGDVLEADDSGRIVAVRSAGDPPIVTHFVPGTASSPDGSDEVRGELESSGGAPTLALLPTDHVEMRGTFGGDDAVPGGGRVDSSRSTGTLVGGLVVLALSYGPSAYIGATSTMKADRSLLIPIAGPWIDFARRSPCVVPPMPAAVAAELPVSPCLPETLNRAAIVTSGIFQGLGALLTIVALPSTTRVIYDGEHAAAPPKPTLAVVPQPTLHGGGVGVVGTF
jgi:hypothetical protein